MTKPCILRTPTALELELNSVQVATPVPPLLNEEQFTALIDCMEAMVMSAADCAVDPSAEIDKLRELIATPTVSVRDCTTSGAQYYCSGGDK